MDGMEYGLKQFLIFFEIEKVDWQVDALEILQCHHVNHKGLVLILLCFVLDILFSCGHKIYLFQGEILVCNTHDYIVLVVQD